MVENGDVSYAKKRQNDPKRFIRMDHTTADRKVVNKPASYIDRSVIENEEQYDGFYTICTNLEDEPETIVKANKQRWEIEECFCILKTNFEAHPAYVKRQDRIMVYSIASFIALIVYCCLYKKSGEQYTIEHTHLARNGFYKI